MSKWVRKPRKCGHCEAHFFAVANKRFCSDRCVLLGHVRKNGDCWEWSGPRVYGYGQAMLGQQPQRKMRAHRAAYIEFVGPIAEGLCVCHRCDNRCCINPEHLFLGTTQENTADKVRKGRQNHSENHARSKLTPEAVREIRAAPPRSGGRLARKYGVSPTAIMYVRRGTNWKHLS